MISLPSTTQYLFESSICLLAFYSLYYFLFRKDTFFQFNRFYLLVSALVSLLIPVVQINILPEVSNQPLALSNVVPILESYNIRYASVLEQVEQPILLSMSIGDFISLIYKLGIFLFGLSLLSKLFKMYDLIRASKATQKPEYTMLKPQDESYMASSFFSYIFWNDSHDEKSKIIIDHELVHVKQRHSLDVVIMELMVVVKWFNPLIYLFRNNLRKTHEYIADRYVSNSLGSKYEYAKFIINENRDDPPNLSNAMFSFVKDRLNMLNAKESSYWNWLKYTAIVPVFACLFMLFSFNMSEELPDALTSPIKELDSRINDLSNTNLITLHNNDTNVWRKQFVWGDAVRINLDEKVQRQDILITVRKLNLSRFLEQLPVITNLDGELHFYPMYHVSDTGANSFSSTDIMDSQKREELVKNIEFGDEINFISEFVFNNKIYKQDVTVRISAFLFGQRMNQSNSYFEWGEITVDYSKRDTNSLITLFNIRDAVFLNQNSEISLTEYQRFFPNSISSWPSFDISKEEYELHLNKKIITITSDGNSVPVASSDVVEIKIMRKFFKRLKSLDLASINEYKKTLDIPEGVRFIPQAQPSGEHEIVQILETTVSQLRNSKQIRDWLLLVDNGDLVEFVFKEEKDDQFGLMFLMMILIKPNIRQHYWLQKNPKFSILFRL